MDAYLRTVFLSMRKKDYNPPTIEEVMDAYTGWEKPHAVGDNDNPPTIEEVMDAYNH